MSCRTSISCPEISPSHVTAPILLLLPALLSLVPSIDHIAASQGASAAHPLGENSLKLGPAVPAPQQGSPKQVHSSL